MAAGDILLFHGHGAFYETLIERGTHGPFCHVEVDLGDGFSIGALAHGVERHPTPTADAVAPVGVSLDPTRLASALTWLHQQVGKRYSALDIAADALKLILPAPTPFLVAPSAFDCSKLAACFLAAAGYPLPAGMFADIERVSPNDVARALGVLMPSNAPATPAMSPRARDFIRRMEANPHMQAVMRRLADK